MAIMLWQRFEYYYYLFVGIAEMAAIIITLNWGTLAPLPGLRLENGVRGAK